VDAKVTGLNLKYSRVVLKVSGESFCAPSCWGIDAGRVHELAGQLAEVAAAGVQLAVVMGAGNILRGSALADKENIQPATAHQMGMLATVMNGLALADSLEALGCETLLTSSFSVGRFTQPYSRREALQALKDGRIVLLTGGTGNPFVTTDTCAAIRAAELSAQALLKATKVEGVYSADPQTDADAVKFDHLTYDEVLDRRLGVMDLAAVQLCKECNIAIIVFNFRTAGSMLSVVRGQPLGTSIGP